MPRPFPREFMTTWSALCRAVIQRSPLAEIAKDFGVHVGTLDKWMRQAQIEAGEQPGQTSSESAELRKRNRLLEQEVEVFRRATAYLSQTRLPGKCSTRS